MSHIIGVGTAVPPHKVSQAEACAFATHYFARHLPVGKLRMVFENAAIETRYFAVPKTWWIKPNHTLKERNDIYLREAVAVGQCAIEQALYDAGVGPGEVDNLIVVSSTGIATPSLDALLINHMKMRPDVRRTPIFGLGCAGGVAGLARAAEMARAYPDSITVLLAVETCGLTFQFGDLSKKNFVAAALFSDGAGAVVIAGEKRAALMRREGAQVVGSQSTLWPDSLRVMGWDVVDQGFEVLFGVEIPQYVARLFRPEVDRFLNQYSLHVADIDHAVLHPGGSRVLEAYCRALDLAPERLTAAREVLRQYGNMSSPTVLFVLDYIMKRVQPKRGEYGLVAALGPGFSAEQALVVF